MKTVTKRDLAKTVSQAVSSRNNTAQEAVDALFSAMREELIKGNRIEIRGFGVLEVRDSAVISEYARVSQDLYFSWIT